VERSRGSVRGAQENMRSEKKVGRGEWEAKTTLAVR